MSEQRGFYIKHGVWLGDKATEVAWLGREPDGTLWTPLRWKYVLMPRSAKLSLAAQEIIATGGRAVLVRSEALRLRLHESVSVSTGGKSDMGLVRPVRILFSDVIRFGQGGHAVLVRLRIPKLSVADSFSLQTAYTKAGTRRVSIRNLQGTESSVSIATGGSATLRRFRQLTMPQMAAQTLDLWTGGHAYLRQNVITRVAGVEESAPILTGGAAAAARLRIRHMSGVSESAEVMTGGSARICISARPRLQLRQFQDIFTGGQAALGAWYFPSYSAPGVLRKRQVKGATLTDGVLRLR